MNNPIPAARDRLAEMRNLRQGYTLDTAQTRQWPQEQVTLNNEREARMVFRDFSEIDEGRARQLIADFTYAEDAEFFIKLLALVGPLLDAVEVIHDPAPVSESDVDIVNAALAAITAFTGEQE